MQIQLLQRKRSLKNLQQREQEIVFQEEAHKQLQQKERKKQLEQGIDKILTEEINSQQIEIKILSDQLKKHQAIIGFLSLIALFVSIFEYEIFYNYDQITLQNHKTQNVMRLVTLVIVILSILLIVQKGCYLYQLSIEKHAVETESRGRQRSILNQTLFIIGMETIVNLIHNPPYLDTNNYAIHSCGPNNNCLDYQVADIILMLMFLRCYNIFKLISNFSMWRTSISEEISIENNCEPDTSFAIKAMLKKNPKLTIILILVLSSVIVGLIVRISQRPIYKNQKNGDADFQDYSYIWNGIWLVMITMLTIGFGDFYPKTFVGQILCSISSMIGVFLISLLVVTLNQSLIMNQNEDLVSKTIATRNFKQQIYQQTQKNSTVPESLDQIDEIFMLQKLQQEQNQQITDQLGLIFTLNFQRNIEKLEQQRKRLSMQLVEAEECEQSINLKLKDFQFY